MSITIRPCVPGDEAALALVGQATFLETYAGVLPDLFREGQGVVKQLPWAEVKG